jgi:hypothetical protein
MLVSPDILHCYVHVGGNALEDSNARCTTQYLLSGHLLLDPWAVCRCGRRRVADYPNIQAWMRDVWQIKIPGGGLQVKWQDIQRQLI